MRRIKASEKEVNEVIARAKHARQDGGRKEEAPTEEEFMLLEEDLSDIIADVHDLAKFTQLNYTGFQKIIKKHDKRTGWHLKPAFAARLKMKPFFKDNYDAFIVKLSKLYDMVRTRGSPSEGDSGAGGGQQNFVRQTTKYWVHPDNITELKLIILKHLPVLVFNPSKEFDPADSAISSIYYDNTDTWELYTGRLKKTEGAEAIRLRWYGGMNTDTIFIERKTHREDWTGEKSVKARFSLKEKNVNDFMAGRMTVDKVFEKMRKDGKKSEKEISDLAQLAREIQYRVIARRLVPVTRSFYNRTAFQLPGDARVRISLDEQLTMVREDNLDGQNRAGRNWRRMDIGIDHPFPQLNPADVERFPYAVLEVKLQTQAGQEPPEWIRELCASHLVEAVPKFSKFIHGTATLQPTRIHLLPYWMPQMHVDIRKPVSHHFGIERPGQSAETSNSDVAEDDSDDDEYPSSHTLQTNGSRPPTLSQQSSDEQFERLRQAQEALAEHEAEAATIGRHLADRADGSPNVLDIEERIAAQPNVHDADYPIYDSDSDFEDEIEEARQRDGWRYWQLLARHHVGLVGSKLLKALKMAVPSPKATEIPGREGTMGIPREGTPGVSAMRFKAPPGKRIHVPVRVEPKVHFATERTFLSWLEFSIILGTIAATLLNFGDALSIASAWGFTAVACLSLFYSMASYLWRIDKIHKRRAVKYHDKYGPTALCVGLFVAVAVSFGLRLRYGGQEGLEG